jgi:hypothetical protein
MIQSLSQRFERVSYFGVVDEPSGFRIDLSAHCHFAFERMSVEPRALVISRDHRQAVRRFKAELFD